MIQKVKDAFSAALALGNRLLDPDRNRAECANDVIVGAAALSRFTINEMISKGNIEAAMKYIAMEEAVYQKIVELNRQQQEAKSLRETHERKLASAKVPDSFQQRPGTC